LLKADPITCCSWQPDAGADLVPRYVTLLGGCAGAAGDGAPKPLVFVRPSDPLQLLVQRLFSERCHMAPVIDGDPLGDSLLINSIATTNSLPLALPLMLPAGILRHAQPGIRAMSVRCVTAAASAALR
jgi:hypothetical protein